jgi:protein tyrosine phosphatase (PTP) superfamily phosphohydrolase (DUF442 family)
MAADPASSIAPDAASDPLTAIRNYLPLTENLITSGCPTPEQFALIRDAGCAVVVNLLPDNGHYPIEEEEDTVRAAGMEYINIPVIWQKPTLDNLRAFFDALDANAHRKVWVHCAVNMRVSAFVYLYRTLQLGWSDVDAAQDLHRIWTPDGWWREFMEEARATFRDSPTSDG